MVVPAQTIEVQLVVFVQQDVQGVVVKVVFIDLSLKKNKEFIFI
jgi:hypothetical protein